METVRGTGGEDARGPRKRDRHTIRWALMGFAVALSLAFGVSSGSGAEVLGPCDDAKGSPCTPVDEWSFCVNNAMDDYEDCKEDSGFFRRAACVIVYDLNFWMCTAAAPLAGYVK